MTQPNPKSPTTYTQQMEKLRSRGCVISDEQKCIHLLSCINYYRLTAYFLPFKQVEGVYMPGTDFITVFRIYEFDRKMRHLIFNAIEEVEVRLRRQIAYFHAHKYGSCGYLDAQTFGTKHEHEKFIKRIAVEKKANRKLPFVQHHDEKYAGTFPLWVIIELFPFGMLSHFYSDMTTQDQKCFARDVFGTTYNNLRSWLYCCTNLRNMCAHYGRMYFHIFPACPKLPNGFSVNKNTKNRLFGAVFALMKLYPDKNKWNEEFISLAAKLIKEYDDVIELSHIGFPSNWQLKLGY